ncbi:hypothetical protein [Mesorhizobium sp. WSM2561]|uniref:hypothetical protein n=1 Tax=Mesorhizobium sp. WSM2561 TaxID=1040985 RepID=UPI0012EB3F7D|nr:hypothetical protein [Mesorhizobium sp. WSM2561]
MTISGILIAFGFLLSICIIVKAFWAANSAKPKEQPDNRPLPAVIRFASVLIPV